MRFCNSPQMGPAFSVPAYSQDILLAQWESSHHTALKCITSRSSSPSQILAAMIRPLMP